jgi:amino acid transporter
VATGLVLKRQLGRWETIAVSVGVMAPTLAMSLTGTGPAGLVGRAAPLVFLFAAIAVVPVAYGFVRLSREFASAGSVYRFVGGAIGPRTGFVAGWALLGTYFVFPPVSIAGVALFTSALLKTTGWAPGADWYWLAVAGWALIWVLAARGLRPTVRSLLAFEGVSLLLIFVLVVAIGIKLGTGHAPRGQRFSLDVARLPDGVPLATIALAATSGFLAFAGFESAGSLGEESLQPRRSIPRAIFTAVGLGGVVYVIAMSAQTLGYGTDAAGVKAFASAATPLNDLAEMYANHGLAAALDIGAVLSAVGAALGGVVVCSRMLLTMSRDRLAPSSLSRVSPSGTPQRAIAVEMVVAMGSLTAFRLAGAPVLHAFFYLATCGVLSLLAMYVITNVAAANHLSRTTGAGAVVLPVIGVVVAAYVIYRNVWPVPPSPFNVFPYLVAGWLLIAALVAIAVPAVAQRVSAGARRQIPAQPDSPDASMRSRDTGDFASSP